MATLRSYLVNDPHARSVRLPRRGIRKPEPFLELFERVVNLIRVHAPDAVIAFNTTGENRVEAVLQWLPVPLP